MSHVIPRFVLLKSKSKGRGVIFRTGEKSYEISQEDWKEYLLCRRCEEVMQRHEVLMQDVFYLNRKAIVQHEALDHIRVRVHSDNVALSLLSICWRAAVSELPAFKWQVLPDYVEQDMRKWLNLGRMPDNWHQLLEIKVQQIEFPIDEPVHCLIPPFIRKQPKSFEFVYVCGGYCWIFIFPPPADQIFSRTRSLKPRSMSVKIEKVPFNAIPELRSTLLEMLSTPLPPDVEMRLPAYRV